MNSPEFILTDELSTITQAVQSSLGLDVLNYQYGYVEELNQTLTQWDKDPTYSTLKFPLVWIMQPFTIVRGEMAIYGQVEGLRIFIINSTDKTWKAAQRLENNFKPIIWPIYREFLKQLDLHRIKGKAVFVHTTHRKHKFTDRYWWGEEQKAVLNDAVDCAEISNIELKINHNPNC